MTIVEVMVVMIVKLVALGNNVVLVGMLIVILGYLNARSCKKIPPAAAGPKPYPKPAPSQPGAARQLKRLQPAQKLEERNPTLIASGNLAFLFFKLF